MKKTWVITGLAVLLSIYAGSVISGGSVEQGKQLFNDPALGGSTNDVSCASCHPDGKGLENSGDKTNLEHMINVCIQRPLKGAAFEEDSIELDSLKRYIKSIK